MNDFIIPLNKQVDVTSAKSLNGVKRNINKKVGHTGTLDKFAEGLLIALTGRYTKLTEEYMNLKTTYLATIKFGEETDTLDPEGKVIYTSSVIPSRDDIKETLSSKFLGETTQTPPLYSALHINGKRASDLARTGVEFEIKERKINIYSNEIVSYENGLLTARFEVSRGTYIRSIARDLGVSLGSRGYLTALKRERIGCFTLSDAVNSDDIEVLKSEYTHQDREEYALAIGVFDGLHPGHRKLVSLLNETASKYGLKSLVITFDKSPKGVSEFLTLDEKINALMRLGVDRVEVLKWNDTLKDTTGASFMLNLIKRFNIKKIVTGHDFSVGNIHSELKIDDLRLFFGKNDIVTLDDFGIDDIKRISSTYIHSLYNSGDKERAKKLLYL